MKELLSVVNSKLQAVIDELKTQKETLENKVKTVVEDIENKVAIASEYKVKVEESNNTISELEEDINKLKKDLRDLHEKFASAGFTELLEAGNREINGKVIEHNTRIAKEQDNIKKCQEEAANLKDELTALKESKTNLELELNNTIVALNYYSAKIDEIATTAIENSDRLSYLTPEEDSLDDTSTADIDVNRVIDGTIFEEIDEISSGDKEISEEELNNILKENVKEEPVTDVIDEMPDRFKSDIKSLTEELEKLQEPIMIDISDEEDSSDLIETVKEEQVVEEDNNDEIVEEPIPEEVVEEPIEDTIETTSEEVVQEETQPIEENVELEEATSLDDFLDKFNEEPQEVEETKVEETTETSTEVDPEKIHELAMLGFNADEFNCDLKFINSINFDNARKILEVLDNHYIDKYEIYNYPQLIVTMNADVLEKEIRILEDAGCLPLTFGYIFSYLDKIDVDKLESTVKGTTNSIISVLYDIVPNLETKNIGEILGLTNEEVNTLQAHLDQREFNIMCTFPEVVKQNYNTIKELKIDDVNKCFTEHPKRFLLNPNVLDEILDKYDTPDLVRCINKNCAVIDKL